MTNPLSLIIVFAVILYSVILHEIAHGFVAEKLGDPTARRAGRLTLNPFPHIDPIMTILLPLLLFITTGIPFGAAKPVPVNSLYFDDLKKDTALVSLAGVVTNFALAGLGSLLYHAFGSFLPPIANEALFYLVQINLVLGVFNLIPIPPLDGSRVLAALLPNNLAASLMALEPFGMLLVFLLVMTRSFGFIYQIVQSLTRLLGMA